jgi:hypothetical protein
MLTMDLEKNIYFIGYDSWNQKYALYTNDTITISGDGTFHKKQILSNGEVYYCIKEPIQDDMIYDTYSVFKGTGEIVINSIKSGIFNFVVSEDEKNIVYTSWETVLSNTFLSKIYLNNELVYTNRNVILIPMFSPDGKKLFYFELFQQSSNSAYQFYINGPNVILGPFIYEYNKLIFSNDSKHFACLIEKLPYDGLYFIIDSELYGPYTRIKNGSYFSDDSSYFIYHYQQKNDDEWNEKRIGF